MSKGVAAGVLIDASFLNGLFDSNLYASLVDVVPAIFTRSSRERLRNLLLSLACKIFSDFNIYMTMVLYLPSGKTQDHHNECQQFD